MFLRLTRSLPSGISSTGVPPVDTSTEDASTAMTKKPSRPILLPILIPVAIALGVYLVLFHVVLPTWRAHRERYRQYLPLHSPSHLTSRLPHILQPSTIASGLQSLLLRIFFPTTYALRQLNPASISPNSNSNTHNTQNGSTTYRASSIDGNSDDEDDDQPLFTAESGEAMLNFGVPHANSDPRDLARRRREGLDRFAGRNLAYARAMEGVADTNDDVAGNGIRGGGGGGLMGGARRPGVGGNNEVHPERRLSRELEAGFRDDSESEGEGEGVKAGRRSFGVGR